MLATPTELVDRHGQNIASLRQRAHRATAARLDRASDDLVHTVARVRALSPAATLERGYAVVQDESGAVLRSVAATSIGATIAIRLADGRVGAPMLVAATDRSTAPDSSCTTA